MLLFLGITWGGSFSLAKIAVEEGAHPLGVNYWQTLIGAALLISYLLVTRQPLPTGRNYLSFYLKDLRRYPLRASTRVTITRITIMMAMTS